MKLDKIADEIIKDINLLIIGGDNATQQERIDALQQIAGACDSWIHSIRADMRQGT